MIYASLRLYLRVTGFEPVADFARRLCFQYFVQILERRKPSNKIALHPVKKSSAEIFLNLQIDIFCISESQKLQVYCRISRFLAR